MTRKPFAARFAAAALTLTATAGVLNIATAPAASAWAYAPVNGTRGNVSVPTVGVGDLDNSLAFSAFTLYTNTGPVAYRSPAAAGVQVVKARYSVERWTNNQWVTVTTSGIMRGLIGSAQIGVRFQRLYIQPTLSRGYFRVTWAFDWLTPSGITLGSSLVRSGHASDHACITRARWCQTGPGWVRTGGYFTNSW